MVKLKKKTPDLKSYYHGAPLLFGKSDRENKLIGIKLKKKKKKKKYEIKDFGHKYFSGFKNHWGCVIAIPILLFQNKKSKLLQNVG